MNGIDGQARALQTWTIREAILFGKHMSLQCCTGQITSLLFEHAAPVLAAKQPILWYRGRSRPQAIRHAVSFCRPQGSSAHISPASGMPSGKSGYLRHIIIFTAAHSGVICGLQAGEGPRQGGMCTSSKACSHTRPLPWHGPPACSIQRSGQVALLTHPTAAVCGNVKSPARQST